LADFHETAVLDAAALSGGTSMLPVQCFQLLIQYWLTMAIIFENIHTKNTKEFVFTVRANNDGSYAISSVS